MIVRSLSSRLLISFIGLALTQCVAVHEEPGDEANGSAVAMVGGESRPDAIFEPPFILGADISSVQEAVDNGTTYRDTDGRVKPMLDLLKNHGFNYVRLRVFVNPLAQFGYASRDRCPGRNQAYCDRDHTVRFAQQIKQANMGLLIDFHYSDTWADPGKQVIPAAWRQLNSIPALAAAVRAHTVDVMRALANAGAKPDMVQIGNEITPGMLIHVPTASSDCFGNNSVRASVNGSTSNWNSLATLLTAGIEGVREVDSQIKIMLHIENTEDLAGARAWVRNALDRGVRFNVLGLSAYEAFQGPPSTWRNTLDSLAREFPQLSFVIAEYNPSRREANDIVRALPGGRGLGTFFWEPTQSGSWGQSMFTNRRGVLEARPADFAVFDAIRRDYGL